MSHPIDPMIASLDAIEDARTALAERRRSVRTRSIVIAVCVVPFTVSIAVAPTTAAIEAAGPLGYVLAVLGGIATLVLGTAVAPPLLDLLTGRLRSTASLRRDLVLAERAHRDLMAGPDVYGPYLPLHDRPDTEAT